MKTSLLLLVGASMLSLGIPSVTHAQNNTTSKSFSDVPANHWAAASVNMIAKAGIVTGYPDGQFKGNQTLDRNEAMSTTTRLPASSAGHDTGALATKDDVTTLRTDLGGKIDAQKAAIDDLHKQLSGMLGDLKSINQSIAGTNQRDDTLQTREKSISKNSIPLGHTN